MIKVPKALPKSANSIGGGHIPPGLIGLNVEPFWLSFLSKKVHQGSHSNRQAQLPPHKTRSHHDQAFLLISTQKTQPKYCCNRRRIDDMQSTQLTFERQKIGSTIRSDIDVNWIGVNQWMQACIIVQTSLKILGETGVRLALIPQPATAARQASILSGLAEKVKQPGGVFKCTPLFYIRSSKFRSTLGWS